MAVAYALAVYFKIDHTILQMGKFKFVILYALLLSFIDFLLSRPENVPMEIHPKNETRRKLIKLWPAFSLLVILPVGNKVALMVILLPLIALALYDFSKTYKRMKLAARIKINPEDLSDNLPED